MLIGLLIRLFYSLCWGVLALLVLPIQCYRRKDTLPKWCYYFDNAEDGFDGDKLGWYSNYLGKEISKERWLQRAWISYKWSVLRNPCFNLRYHPLLSVDVTQPKDIVYRGNTYFHTRKWHYDKNETGKLWYWISAKYDGKERHSFFFLLPIPFTDKDLYLRFGLKIYPRHYFDKYWLDKISKEGWPHAKDKGVYAISIRIR